MPMIPERDQKAIREHLAQNLREAVTVDYFTQKAPTLALPIQQCRFCQETGELLQEVAALSDRITLRTFDLVADATVAEKFGIQRIPAFVISGRSRGRVRYFGIPSGYEFSALIEDLVDVAQGNSHLGPAELAALQKLQRDVHLQVFSTPT